MSSEYSNYVALQLGYKRRRNFYREVPEPTSAQAELLFSAYKREEAGESDVLIDTLSSAPFRETLDSAPDPDVQQEALINVARATGSAKQFLFRSLLGTADRAASSVHRNPSDELVQEGVEEIYSSLRDFDPLRPKADLGGYVYTRVRRKLIDYLRENGEYSRADYKKFKQVGQIVSDLRHELGKEPDESEIRAQLGDRSEKYKDRALLVYANPAPRISLDEQADFASKAPGPEEVVLGEPLSEIMETAIEQNLTQREQDIIRCHLNGEPHAVIAAKQGVNESRISQLLTKIRGKLSKDSTLKTAMYGYAEGEQTVYEKPKNNNLSKEMRSERDALIAELVATTDLSKAEIAKRVEEKLGITVNLMLFSLKARKK